MDQVVLTKAQLERLAKLAERGHIVILNSNTDAGLVYAERVKYRGQPGEGKWFDRSGREVRKEH